MRRAYSQKNTTVTVDGVTIRGFMDGASIIVTHDGGEVDKTQGTDGPGINLATNQGMTIQFTLRENSPSRAFLKALRQRQENGGDGVTTVVRTGVNVLHSMPFSFISQPGALNTGDKKMGGLQYTLMSETEDTSNLESDLSIGDFGGASNIVS